MRLLLFFCSTFVFINQDDFPVPGELWFYKSNRLLQVQQTDLFGNICLNRELIEESDSILYRTPTSVTRITSSQFITDTIQINDNSHLEEVLVVSEKSKFKTIDYGVLNVKKKNRFYFRYGDEGIQLKFPDSLTSDKIIGLSVYVVQPTFFRHAIDSEGQRIMLGLSKVYKGQRLVDAVDVDSVTLKIDSDKSKWFSGDIGPISIEEDVEYHLLWVRSINGPLSIGYLDNTKKQSSFIPITRFTRRSNVPWFALPDVKSVRALKATIQLSN